MVVKGSQNIIRGPFQVCSSEKAMLKTKISCTVRE